jgi:hypothetical protein
VANLYGAEIPIEVEYFTTEGAAQSSGCDVVVCV